MPKMDELLRYEDQFYVEITPQTKALKAFLEIEMQMDEELAKGVLLGQECDR